MRNKDKLILVACRLFHLYGYKGTSVDMIMRESGVCRSNFYYYFSSKEALAMAAIKKTSLMFRDKVLTKTLLNGRLTPLERLDSFYEEAISIHNSLFSEDLYAGCFFGNLALEQSSNKDFRSALNLFFTEWYKAFRLCLEEGVERGFFKKDIDPENAARLLISQIEGAILLSKVRNSMDPLVSVSMEMRKLIVNA